MLCKSGKCCCSKSYLYNISYLQLKWFKPDIARRKEFLNVLLAGWGYSCLKTALFLAMKLKISSRGPEIIQLSMAYQSLFNLFYHYDSKKNCKCFCHCNMSHNEQVSQWISPLDANWVNSIAFSKNNLLPNGQQLPLVMWY